MELFKTNDMNIVKHCQREFNFNIPSDILAIRCEIFFHAFVKFLFLFLFLQFNAE